MLVGLVLVAVGLVVLTKASDAFVDGACGLASIFRLSPIVIGAVVIGFGTSVPEMLVSAIAAGRGDRDLGLGNIVGSNVANLSLVLGAAALVGKIAVDATTRRREIPISVGACVLFTVLTIGGLSRIDGAVLVVTLVFTLWYLIRSSSEDDVDPEVAGLLGEEPDGRAETIRTMVGLVGTVIGAQLLVDGGIRVATALELSEGFVGFSLVAIGTSLPELVTAVVAARKQATDLIIGNLLGSNLFNSLAVGGAVAMVGPGDFDDRRLVSVGLPIMLGIVGLAAVLMSRPSIGRKGAILLLGCYAVTLPLVANGASTDEAFERPATELRLIDAPAPAGDGAAPGHGEEREPGRVASAGR